MTPSLWIRRALLAALAVGAPAWLLVRPLFGDAVPGAPTAGIYGVLQAWSTVVAPLPDRFPEPGTTPVPDTLAHVLRPLVAGLGVVPTVKLVMFAGLAATLAVTWRFARARGADEWTSAVATAVFAASPAVIAGVASGDLDAWHGWALLALPLCRDARSVLVGGAIALAAPTFLPAALLPAIFLSPEDGLTRWRGRLWPVVGWVAGMGLRTALGWPTIASGAGWDAWFTGLEPSPAPERIYQVYVGFTAIAGLLLAAAGARAWAWVGGLALLGSLLTGPVPPERFLHLVPLAAALGGLEAARKTWPAWGPVVAVLGGAALLGEGWQGVATPVPLLTAPLADPAPVEQLAEGPVLDLPLTRGPARRALWYQVHHRHPIAPDADGLVTADVAELGATLSAGGCADPATLGFTTVVAQREGPLRELGPLTTCLGKPTWDDGAVAVWRLGSW